MQVIYDIYAHYEPARRKAEAGYLVKHTREKGREWAAHYLAMVRKRRGDAAADQLIADGRAAWTSI
jgi:hypothetical protein